MARETAAAREAVLRAVARAVAVPPAGLAANRNSAFRVDLRRADSARRGARKAHCIHRHRRRVRLDAEAEEVQMGWMAVVHPSTECLARPEVVHQEARLLADALEQPAARQRPAYLAATAPHSFGSERTAASLR